MFNIGPAELLIIGLVLLIAVGPEQLPGVLRRAGSTVAQLRSMTDGLRSEFMAGLDEIERATDVERWAEADSDPDPGDEDGPGDDIELDPIELDPEDVDDAEDTDDRDPDPGPEDEVVAQDGHGEDDPEADHVVDGSSTNGASATEGLEPADGLGRASEPSSPGDSEGGSS